MTRYGYNLSDWGLPSPEVLLMARVCPVPPLAVALALVGLLALAGLIAIGARRGLER